MEFVEGQSLAAMVGRADRASATLARHRRAAGAGAGGGARRRHRPPRHQARERHGPRRRLREGARLRPGAPRAAPPIVAALTDRRHDPTCHPGHAALHVARAGARRDGVSARATSSRSASCSTSWRPAGTRSRPDSTLGMLHAITSSTATSPLRCGARLPPRARSAAARDARQVRARGARGQARSRRTLLAASPAGPSAARAPASGRGGRPPDHNLPPQRTPLVGRAAELASVKDLLLDASGQAAHADRTGRHRQDTPRHPGGRGSASITSMAASRSSTSRRSPIQAWSPPRSPARSACGRAATSRS